MAGESEKKETPVPGTVAEDGRRNLGAHVSKCATTAGEIQGEFFTHVRKALSVERIEAYGNDGATHTITLARYLLNLALCESLYSPLQLCEVALRNSLHRHLAGCVGMEDWFDSTSFKLAPWAVAEVFRAKDKITRSGRPVTPGRVIAELQFGFWTSLFEGQYEGRNGFLPSGIKEVFPHLPKSLHNRKGLKRTLETIRMLRNRVFHHERIIHWNDISDQHASILEVIGWINPELHEMALALDRFTSIRRAGLQPWILKLCHHWPNGSDEPVNETSKSGVAIIPAVFDAANGAETPFGHRWGGEVFSLSREHLDVLTAGRTLALDVQSEYVVFLKHAAHPPHTALPTSPTAQSHESPDAKIGATGHGG